MYLDLYKIEGTNNLDSNPCFSNSNTFPQFQEGLDIFKSHMKQLVNDKESKTFYKFDWNGVKGWAEVFQWLSIKVAVGV